MPDPWQQNAQLRLNGWRDAELWLLWRVYKRHAAEVADRDVARCRLEFARRMVQTHRLNDDDTPSQTTIKDLDRWVDFAGGGAQRSPHVAG